MFITEPETNVIINIDTVCNTVMRMSAQLRNVRVGVKVPVILGRSHPPHRQDLPPGGDPPLLKTDYNAYGYWTEPTAGAGPLGSTQYVLYAG